MADNILHATDADFASKTAQGIVLVDFYADWCGPCRMIAPILEKVAVKLNGKATVLKVNTDEAGQSATQLRITSIPTMIIYKEGKEVSRHVGIKDEKGLISWVESHL